MKVADCEAEEAKEINMKSKFHFHITEQVYNRLNKAVLTTAESNTNNTVIKKKRK